MSEEIKKLKEVLEETTIKQTTVTTDLLLRITALEDLLIDKGVISKEDYHQSLSDIARKLEALIKASKEGGNE